jgi:hypothetical protein
VESDFDIDKILSEIDEDEEKGVLDLESNDTVTNLSNEDNFEHARESGAEEENDSIIKKDNETLPGLTAGESSLTREYTEEGREESSVQDEIISEKEIPPENEETAEQQAGHGFTVMGTKSWNTREPYLIDIIDEKLGQNETYFRGAFFFIREDIDEKTIQNEIKRSLAGFMRNPSKNISEEYREFIFSLLLSESDSIIRFFNIPDDKIDLFIYHTGPSTMHKILLSRFKKKIGLAYRYDNANRRAISFFPEEFIKLKVLEWHEDNINRKELPFDSAQILDELTTIVSRSYLEEKKKFNRKLDTINYKLGPGKRISSQELIRLKGDEWFGSGSIAVYKRFLQKTMFK